MERAVHKNTVHSQEAHTGEPYSIIAFTPKFLCHQGFATLFTPTRRQVSTVKAEGIGNSSQEARCHLYGEKEDPKT